MLYLIPLPVFLRRDEQLVVTHLSKRFTVNGPKVYFTPALSSTERRNGITLAEHEYVVVQDSCTGETHRVVGPQMMFMKADERIIVGPTSGYQLSPTQYLRLKNRLNGRVSHIPGPQLYIPHKDECDFAVKDAFQLSPEHYITVSDTETGKKYNVIGPQTYFLGPHEECLNKNKITTLTSSQYLRLQDSITGEVRVERGEASVVLSPTETMMDGGPKQCPIVDQDHAVIVRDMHTGTLRIVTEPQVYVPDSRTEVVSVEKRVKLEEYQKCVVVGKDGEFTLHNGDGAAEERSFFVPPYCRLLNVWWSTGIKKDTRGLKLDRFDSRPRYMWYSFGARTKDNVVIELEVTFFWQIVDVMKMIRNSDDTSGDVCSHARSAILQSVGKLTLDQFLQTFNTVVQTAVLGSEESGSIDAAFYDTRGIRIMGIEVRSVACQDPETQSILQDIIIENTARVNRLQKQESENEVELKRFAGEIEAERMKDELLNIRAKLRVKEGTIEGQSEAARVKEFMSGLSETVPNISERMNIFNTLRRQEIFDSLSKGKATMVFAPDDCNLRLDARGGGDAEQYEKL